MSMDIKFSQTWRKICFVNIIIIILQSVSVDNIIIRCNLTISHLYHIHFVANRMFTESNKTTVRNAISVFTPYYIFIIIIIFISLTGNFVLCRFAMLTGPIRWEQWVPFMCSCGYTWGWPPWGAETCCVGWCSKEWTQKLRCVRSFYLTLWIHAQQDAKPNY
jgi:hypothetical protein